MNPTAALPADAAAHDPRSWRERNHETMMLGLAWLRRLLEAHLVHLRSGPPPQAFAGAGTEVMSDLKADWLLRELNAAPHLGDRHGDGDAAARQAYEAARAALRDAGEPAAIDRLAGLFGLAPFDEDLLLMALAPHLDAAFQALYGYAHDRLSLGHATPHLALALLAPEPTTRAAARERLAPGAPLRRFALIIPAEADTEAQAPLRIDERVAGYLLDTGGLDPRVRVGLRSLTAGPCPARHSPVLEDLAARLDGAPRTAALLIGPRGCGRRALAGALAGRLGLGLVELEPRALPAELPARHARFALIAREAALSGFALAIDLHPDAAPGADDAARLAWEVAEQALAGLDAVVILLAHGPVALPVPIPAGRLPALTAADRAALWRRLLDPATAETSDGIDAVAEQFALGPAEIATIATAHAQTQGDAQALWSACRAAAGRGLDTLAEAIEPSFGWDDIVLPVTVRHDLEALAAQVRHRTQVYGQWGFGRRLPRGRGVSALFSGPSGVGKTMAAEVIAHDLALDLYRIDLSGIVSKYIGETEKNLRRVFDAAEEAGAVLFFDEADALFGKRSEVRDSHDRYANIEVSYLLQRMETYSGLAILATNLKTHLDQAFLRRLRCVIDFPFPDAGLRRAIWQRAFPPEAPSDRLDFDALARLEIAGGNITVVAVNAAFLAAAAGQPIGMGHVAHAAQAEFRKLDKELRGSWPGV